MKEFINVPVFYYHDRSGRIVLDEKNIKKHLDKELYKIKLETKKGFFNHVNKEE